MEEKTLLLGTLVFLMRGNEVLLPMKMKKIGAGSRNGYGGGVEDGESEVACAARESSEEAGIEINPKDLKKIAIVDFHNMKSDGTTFICKVHVFVTDTWKGDPKETDEMSDPKWFLINKIPLDELMKADPFWLPDVLKGKKLIAKAHYGPFQKELLSPVEITYVDHLD